MRKSNHFGNSCNSCTRSLGLILTPFICISGWIYQSAISAQPVCARATCVRGLSVQAIKAPLIVFLTPRCAAPSSSPVTAGAYSSTSRLTPRHPATATRTERARTPARAPVETSGLDAAGDPQHSVSASLGASSSFTGRRWALAGQK